MALGQAKRFRFRNTDSPRRKPINGKKLDFSTPTRTPANKDSDSDSDSLFQPKVEMNKQLKFDDLTNDMSTSDSESDVSVHEKSTTELENLDGFDDAFKTVKLKNREPEGVRVFYTNLLYTRSSLVSALLCKTVILITQCFLAYLRNLSCI